MGKPTLPARKVSNDGVSLHTQPGEHERERFLDDDAPELQVDDLPPLYEEAVEGSSSSGPLLPADPPRPAGPGDVVDTYPFQTDANSGSQYYLDSRLDNDPKLLERHIQWWALVPPRPHVRLIGTHTQNVYDAGKKEKKTVTDFDIFVELTPYLYLHANTLRQQSWRELRTAENGEKVRRGTVLRKRAPGARQSVEVGLADKPTLAEWCHRYCASHAGLKCFALRRRMVGFDEDNVRRKLESLVRRTNYRGHLQITFPVKNEWVEVYNECKTNTWRLTNWIWWLCAFSLMFIFTWPYLFFRTKRFEVVFADWHFSRVVEGGRRDYVSMSEDQWYNLWGRAINRAVLEKRQGTLDQQDLLASEGAEPLMGDSLQDNAISFVRAGVSAMNELNRQFGWGHDS
ncbi:putative abc transporter protein [Diplogelasinospora grovesii]|uniref:Abc transporter protein n=1 Tax=Diplogelasinospora grovesii TaxID=303347 RepID=A0AAN6N2J3_9PEZI|nr:putative abc transporter protein [Diplogelasinospora grovesii]